MLKQYFRLCNSVQVYFENHIMRRNSEGLTCLISRLKVQGVYLRLSVNTSE